MSAEFESVEGQVLKASEDVGEFAGGFQVGDGDACALFGEEPSGSSAATKAAESKDGDRPVLEQGWAGMTKR